jgi:hypothetical protein
MSDETYEAPAHGWTCFHCGETFRTVGAARDHFGVTPTAQPGCIERVRLGAERGLLMALRDAEARIARYMEDDTDTQRMMMAMQSRQADALRVAEEAGYERGLRDALAEASNVQAVGAASAAPARAQSYAPDRELP